MVTVIIGILFIAAIGTILLTIASRYLISVNVDHNASDNFYQTEGILEEVKTGLLEYAGDAGEEAYKDVVEHYTKTKDSMHKTFSEKYISLLASKLMGYSYAWDESKVGTEQSCDLSIFEEIVESSGCRYNAEGNELSICD